MDELFEALTLIQTDKIKPFPVVLFGTDYWSGLMRWIEMNMLASGMISSEDRTIFTVTDSIQGVVEIMKNSQP
jgi:predicted Rossmann-fold nucleotide-binding protein